MIDARGSLSHSPALPQGYLPAVFVHGERAAVRRAQAVPVPVHSVHQPVVPRGPARVQRRRLERGLGETRGLSTGKNSPSLPRASSSSSWARLGRSKRLKTRRGRCGVLVFPLTAFFFWESCSLQKGPCWSCPGLAQHCPHTLAPLKAAGAPAAVHMPSVQHAGCIQEEHADIQSPMAGQEMQGGAAR